MKQSWTRLLSLFKVHPKFKEPVFNRVFMKHHKNACEIHLDKDGVPMCAVYFTPQATDKMSTKAIFAEIRKRTQYACEQDDIT